MKQKDLAVILAVAGISTLIAFVAANILIGNPKNRQAEIKVLSPISSTFPTPDTMYFNKDSINPTKPVQISPNDNQQPFKQ